MRRRNCYPLPPPATAAVTRNLLGVRPPRRARGGSIYTSQHLVVSVAVGAGLAVWAGLGPLAAAALVAYAAVLGTAIDLDHLLLARYNTGSWRTTRFVVRHPDALLVDQDRIFEDDDVTAMERLLTHVVVGGAVVGGLAFVSPFLAAASAVVLYAHVLADVAWEVREERHEGRIGS